MPDFPKPEELIGFLKDSQEIARMGAQVSNRYFRGDFDVERKADQSPVTVADRESEREMRRYIETRFPEHQVIGEEFGSSGTQDSPWKWVLDPIDGTKSFIHGIPLYTVLIALLYENQPIIGVIYNPQSDEMVAAGAGMGCWYNGQLCKVSQVSRLEEARMQVTDPGDLIRRLGPSAAQLMTDCRLSRSWGDGYGYLLVATGRSEIMIDPIMNLWDVACLKPIIEEAGGRFTDVYGKAELGESSIATNGLVHDQVMNRLNPGK